MADLSQIKILGKIDLKTGKLIEGDPNVLGFKPEPPKPVDHSGTCSSCGGHSHYGYCDRCDDLF